MACRWKYQVAAGPIEGCDSALRGRKVISDMADKGNPVTDRYGNPTGEHQRNVSAMIKAIEVMGRFDGELTERRDVTTRSATIDKPLAELEQERRELVDKLASMGLDEDGRPLLTKH